MKCLKKTFTENGKEKKQEKVCHFLSLNCPLDIPGFLIH